MAENLIETKLREYTAYHENDRLALQEFYLDDKLEGERKTYYESGKLYTQES